MKHREVDLDYVSTFIDEKGGYMEVVKHTGIGKQTIWQLATKRNGVSERTAEQLKQYYPDFDVARARGLNPSPTSPAGAEQPAEAVIVELATLRAENKTLRAENTRLNDTIVELKGMIGQLQDEIRGYARDFRKLAFPTASSYSPVFTATITRAGFKHYDDAETPECKVMPLWSGSVFTQVQAQVASN